MHIGSFGVRSAARSGQCSKLSPPPLEMQQRRACPAQGTGGSANQVNVKEMELRLHGLIRKTAGPPMAGGEGGTKEEAH